MKNYKPGIILGIISIITTLTIVGVPFGSIVIRIGFLPGMVISIADLILTNRNKDKYKTKASFIINIISLVLSILSLMMVILSGKFIANM